MKSMLIFLLGCSSVLYGQTQEIPILDFEAFQTYLQKENDTIYVINFWATWCKPCVEELPFLEQLNRDEFANPISVVLVSLDFPEQMDTRLIPFLNEHSVQSRVVVLDDPDANAWIDQVDPQWSGALPATIIYQGSRRLFIDRQLENYEELVAAVKSL